MSMKSTRGGPTENISVSMPTELVSELRSRTGRCGLFSYMTEAVRHQLAMDGLAEIVACHEEEHGALTEATRRELFGDVNAKGVERGAA